MSKAAARSSAPGEANWFTRPPLPLPPEGIEAAERAREDLLDAAEQAGCKRLQALCQGSGGLSSFLASAASLSQFLHSVLERRPQILEALFDTGVEQRLARIFDELAADVAGETEGQLMARLRRLKGEAHALIGLADLSRTQAAQETVRQLSQLAEACICAAVRFLLRDAEASGRLKLPQRDDPQAGCGWIVIGMGKLGAAELNFSSDIDLIVMFDPEAPAIVDPDEAGDLFVRLTRRLVRILQDRTGDGYVFRTDLRLRPDPGSTPLAISVDAAMTYYEGRGQNWERAAMIKARPIAGDAAAGARFLKELRPFVWRKYMDFAAIADVHSIKRQIHAHRGHEAVAVRGHNVKLGRGGIREIEFFVQTQQLIAGGRVPELRGRETVPMLDMLAQQKWIEPETADVLGKHYWFLRDVEHRIQIVADEQTHVLPEDDEGFTRVARLMGFEDEAAFEQVFRSTLVDVEQHYAALFETAPQLSSGLGNLVFTGDVDDPGTLETLANLGFERPSDMIRLVRGWHYGRYRATRSAEARERLTELTPALLRAFSRAGRPDETAVRFDGFLAGLPAGIQLFSLLQNNQPLLDMLMAVMSAAPRLAETITRSPHVFDGLLDPRLLSELPSRDYLAGRLHVFLEAATGLEEALDRLRIFTAEQRFLIGMRLLTGLIDAGRAGRAFSHLADLAIGHALSVVQAEMEAKHGSVPGGRVAILGMGKLGSRELTASSDVDLILIYDHDEGAEWSDGAKPLASSQYFARLTQRLIAALSAPTAQGILYELDLRLRPSGNKGPVATHIAAFRSYQERDAWTWEHMALTRARAVAGDESLGHRLVETIDAVLINKRPLGELRKAAREMRALLEEEKPPRDEWDLKLMPGGLIDLEFIAQVAVLAGAVESQGRVTGTGEILRCLSPAFVEPGSREVLVRGHDLYTALTQVIRLCVTEPFDGEGVLPGLSDLLLRATDLPDFTVLEAHVAQTAVAVRSVFNELMKA